MSEVDKAERVRDAMNLAPQILERAAQMTIAQLLTAKGVLSAASISGNKEDMIAVARIIAINQATIS